jgi:hypothetical protein
MRFFKPIAAFIAFAYAELFDESLLVLGGLRIGRYK